MSESQTQEYSRRQVLRFLRRGAMAMVAVVLAGPRVAKAVLNEPKIETHLAELDPLDQNDQSATDSRPNNRLHSLWKGALAVVAMAVGVQEAEARTTPASPPGIWAHWSLPQFLRLFFGNWESYRHPLFGHGIWSLGPIQNGLCTIWVNDIRVEAPGLDIDDIVITDDDRVQIRNLSGIPVWTYPPEQ